MVRTEFGTLGHTPLEMAKARYHLPSPSWYYSHIHNRGLKSDNFYYLHSLHHQATPDLRSSRRTLNIAKKVEPQDSTSVTLNALAFTAILLIL